MLYQLAVILVDLYQNWLCSKLFQNILTSLMAKHRIICSFPHKLHLLRCDSSFVLFLLVSTFRYHTVGQLFKSPLPYCPCLPESEPCSTFICQTYYELAGIHFVGPPWLCGLQNAHSLLFAALHQCFSTFVRPRPGKLFFYKTRARSQQIYS